MTTSTKHLCTAKEIITKMKRQPIEQEKVFPYHISDKGLIAKIYKEHLQKTVKKKTK